MSQYVAVVNDANEVLYKAPVGVSRREAHKAFTATLNAEQNSQSLDERIARAQRLLDEANTLVAKRVKRLSALRDEQAALANSVTA